MRLAAAAVVVAAAAVVVTANGAATAVAQQQDQDDDPANVTAAKTVVIHNEYLQNQITERDRSFQHIPLLKFGAEISCCVQSAGVL